MKAHLVCYEDVNGWILGKFARRLREQLDRLGVSGSISKEPDPTADINHHIIYFDYDGRRTTTETVMITHIDAEWKQERVRQQLMDAAMGICMSSRTMNQLAAAGIPREKLCFISPAHDGIVSRRKTRLGITSRVYSSGCKREGFLLELIRRISPADFAFRIMGAGWDAIVSEARQRGFEVDYSPEFDRDAYYGLIPTLDYFLYFGVDEGSMGFLEAAAAGVPTIVSRTGYHLDAPDAITHAFDTADELVRIFERLSYEKQLRRDAVQSWTWDEYARRHVAVWRYLLQPAHGLRDAGEDLTLREAAVLLPESSQPAPAARQTAMHKPRVLLIADVPDWIFARHCRYLVQHLSDEFEFTITYRGEPFDEDAFDLIYPLEWNLVPSDAPARAEKYVTGVRSQISWGDRRFDEFTRYLRDRFQRVHVVSQRLHDLLSPFVPGLTYLTHGVDTDFFTPTSVAGELGARLRVGWAGNAAVAEKGFDEFVAPLAEDVPGVELVSCGFRGRHLDQAAMRTFYDSVDVYVCASSREGNNNSLLEAASMQRAIITTSTGTVPEYLTHGVSALIVEREYPAFLQAVLQLQRDRSRLCDMGRAARQAVAARFGWHDALQGYRSLFMDALRVASERRGKTVSLELPRPRQQRQASPQTPPMAMAAHAATQAELRQQLTRARHVIDMERTVIPRLLALHLKQVTIYGAGEAGVALADALQWHGVTVERFVDADQRKQGTTLCGIPVVSLEEAVHQGAGTFVVGSFAFADEIRATIAAAFQTRGPLPLILVPGTAEVSNGHEAVA